MTALVIRGDARHLPLPDASVDLIVTSPPYFGLRSYTDGGEHYAGQIGDEASPREYVDNLLACTREWMRVLKPEGSLWLNLGDKYAQNRGQFGPQGASGQRANRAQAATYVDAPARRAIEYGAPAKSLLGLPWRYAIGCVDELGLILRAEVIWAKPNGLPESVTDRVRRSHEQWFHMVKQPSYFSAVDEIREQQIGGHSGLAATFKRSKSSHTLVPGQYATQQRDDRPDVPAAHPLGKLPGSVWEVATRPLKVPAELEVDHFAAFPTEWPRRLILGWSPAGICLGCGVGRRPVIASTGLDMTRPQARRALELVERHGLTDEHIAAVRAVGVSDTGRGAATQTGTGRNTERVHVLAAEARTVLGGYAREFLLQRPTGFEHRCACPDSSAPTRPAVVLDPFGGTGTTALVASVLGRRGVTVDRSADYCRIAQWRTTDPGERARVLGLPKPQPVPEGQPSLFDELGEAS
ncbi:site-specific DNA-methyltransferase [Microbispora amethystogenes]|uniref:DNA-methyltransferase n=1 Tax=Microbispora amethystogenes TaxID=1427754 RepID=UPI0033E79F35